jgi:tRNA G18 (ribose-2'-O)-methylase SpoU
MIVINDIDDERISFYRSLRYTPKSHIENRVFVAEEEKVVLKLLHSELEVVSIFACSEYIERYIDLIRKKHIPDNQIFTADKALMKKIVGYRLHSGFMAIGRQPDNVETDKLNRPLIILNALANAENVGSIVRNAAAFGFQSIIYDEATVSPYLRRSVRVSMGNVFHLDISYSNSVINTIKELKAKNIKIVAIEICNDSVPLNTFNPVNKNYALIFGSEGKGINQEVLDLADTILHIPISPNVASLNVASSSAIVLKEFSQL